MKISRVFSPALLGDDHLGLVPVELEPQRPVAEVDLGPHPRAAGGEGDVPERRPRAGVGRVDAAGALAQLVRRAEVTAAGGGGGESRGRQHGAQVERWGVPAGAGRGVHRPTGVIRDEGAGARCLWALLADRGGDVVPVSTHPVLCIPAACRRVVPIHSRRLAPIVCCFFRRGEGVAFSLTAQHDCSSRPYSVSLQKLITFFDPAVETAFFLSLPFPSGVTKGNFISDEKQNKKNFFFQQPLRSELLRGRKKGKIMVNKGSLDHISTRVPSTWKAWRRRRAGNLCVNEDALRCWWKVSVISKPKIFVGVSRCGVDAYQTWTATSQSLWCLRKKEKKKKWALL